MTEQEETSKLLQEINSKLDLIIPNTLQDIWIPKKEVMNFFNYKANQMREFEKENKLIVSQIKSRKFYLKASILNLLNTKQINGQIEINQVLKAVKNSQVKIVSIKVNIDRANVFRFIDKMKRFNSVYLVRKGICAITKDIAGFYTSNYDLYSAHKGLKR